MSKNKQKRILFITAFPPNNRSGGQYYTFNCLRDLSDSFDIDLIYFTYPAHSYSEIPGVKLLKTYSPELKNCFRKPLLFPLFTKRMNRELIRFLRNEATEYDVLYFDFSQVATLSLFINHPMKIVRCHDVIAQKYLRVNRLFYLWAKLTEKKVLSSFHYIFTPSESNVELINSLYNLKSDFTHEYICANKISWKKELQGFILFGLWSRKENLEGLIWFVENVLKSKKRIFTEKVTVMGGGLSDEINDELLKPMNIEYLGFVEDCQSEIEKSKAMIVPLFKGAGIKVKVLDSFSAGTPVIGTDVALEGIPYVEGLQIRANTCDEFIDALNGFEDYSIEKKHKWQDKFIKEYDNNHMGEKIEKLFMEGMLSE